MTAPDRIQQLVELFERNQETYLSQSFNETMLRHQFVDPFFIELGWDVNNEQGYAEQYKDVVHEDSIKVAQGTKAPDYGFRVGGVRKFFVETKRPSINIYQDAASAFQLRRYAWSAKLPLSVLTDFEEFAVYDCRVKPHKNDPASKARILYLKCSDYIERWDEIESIFSKEAVLKGSFDKYAESKTKKRGTTEVDDAFLAEIETWREELARNVALRNPNLSGRDLNFAVQRTIDRIVFLRICEDRGIEDYGRLLALASGTRIYARLCEWFHKADDRYNSGMFHFRKEPGRDSEPDAWTLKLTIDESVLKSIILHLYYPESPYEFSVLPADILGQVYERFLGKVIRLTSGGRAKVEEKPEVRKAGGVYYTPTYIVKYIVENTIGKLLEGKKPGSKIARELRVLDPACGSGSFLLEAYQFLLDWHLKQYVDAGPEKHSKKLRQVKKDEWRLTPQERKRILLNNIYGVDIDSQAVEVTKLSLLLKVLEGENQETVNNHLLFDKERALPDLSANIKCGNSLIGSDYYTNHQDNLFDEEEVYRVNAFDWEKAFPDIMKAGGFDAVIGNPPWVRQESLGKIKEYLHSKYTTFTHISDLYVPFIEKGVTLIVKGGLFSYIVSNKWMRANYGKPLRKWLRSQCLEEIIDFGDLPVFSKVSTYPCIIRISRSKPSETLNAVQIDSLDFDDLNKIVQEKHYQIKTADLCSEAWTLLHESENQLFARIQEGSIPLKEYVNGEIYRGVLTGFNKAFVIDAETRDRLINADPKSAELIKPFLMGRDIKRYQTPEAHSYLLFVRRGTEIEEYPAVQEHLSHFRKSLRPKPTGWQKAWKGRKPGPYQWYEIQDATAYYKEFEKSKILWPEIAGDARFCIDTENQYVNNKVFLIPTEDYYLLGILNSRLLRAFIQSVSTDLQGNSYNFSGIFVQRTPIHKLDLNNRKDIFVRARMVSLVQRMLELHKRLATAKTPHSKTVLQRQIEVTDEEIDRLVYELYGLTDEEIAIVENSTAKPVKQ